MQKFFESTTGQIITVAIIIILFILIIIPGKNEKDKKPDAKNITVSAILIALGMILGQIKLFHMPEGGAVTLFSMLPIALCSYILGTRRGVMAGMCLGLLNLIFGPFVIHPVQLILDYPLAFGAMGLGGLFRNSKDGLRKCYVTGLVGRYICAFLSGVIFFGAYAPDNFNAVTWSLWYNFTYIAAEGAITFIIISIPSVRTALEKLKYQQ